MDNVLLTIGNILMLLLAFSSLISALILLVKIINGQEYKDNKYIKNLNKDLTLNTYLRMNLGIVVSRKFIYGHKNTGSSPCDLKDLEIDDRYLTTDSNVLMNKESYE